MNPKIQLLTLLCLSFTNSFCQVASQKDSLQKFTLLKGEVSLTKNKSEKTPVLIENYILSGNQRIKIDPPVKGLWLVQAKAGDFLVVSEGKERKYETGDFWIVKPGSELIIATEDDAVIIQLYCIGEDFLKTKKNIAGGDSFKQMNEQYKSLVAGAFAKESYVIGEKQNPLAKILDINVGPGQKSESIKFKGPSVIQVISGEGRLIIQGKEQDGTLGYTVALNPEESFVVNNEKTRPIILRAIIYQN